MLIGILLIVLAIINSVGIINKEKGNKFPVLCIINYWILPIVYTTCYCCVLFANISLYSYGMVVVLVEKAIYLNYWRKYKR